MTKARLILLLVFAALFASYAAGLLRVIKPSGMNDGGWID